MVQQLALALGLGLLVGLQREWTAPHVAGIRTFALVTVFGTLLGLLSDSLGLWILVGGMLALAAMSIVAGVMKFSDREEMPGLTTQVSLLVMYSVGVAISLERWTLGIIVGGGVAMLLQWKKPLHGFVQQIGKEDIRAIFQLVLIGLVILPLLPDKAYDPYEVINPFKIWLMVVLICGISVGSYLAYRSLGPRSGSIVAGVLGGLISSTATTVSYSRHARKTPKASGLAALVITIASGLVFVRVIAEVAIVAPSILYQLVPPLAVLLVLMLLMAGVLYFTTSKAQLEVQLEKNPANLMTAIIFGILYTVVLLAVAVAKANFGDESLYAVAALSGLTDMDAITLSTAQMINSDRLDIDIGWRMIIIGGISNMVFKAIVVGLLGSRQLLRRILVIFGISFLVGVLIVLLWP